MTTFQAVAQHALKTGAPTAPALPKIGSLWHPSDGSRDAGAGASPGTRVTTDGLVTQNGYVIGYGKGRYPNTVNTSPDTTFPVQPYHQVNPLKQPYGLPNPPNIPIVADGYQGPPPPPPLGSDPSSILAGLKNGKDLPPAATPGAGVDPAYQAAIGGLVKNLNSLNGADFSVPYNKVNPALIADPFGKNGYQPPAKLEASLVNGINSDMNQHNYLGAFLPGAIQEVAQYYGPQIAAQLYSGANQANTIQGYNRGADQLLSQLPSQVGQDFNNSISLQHQLDKGIQKSLSGLNPNNADLLPHGADPAQIAMINQQNKQGFNGAGAVLSGIGDLNASSLAAQKASALQSVRELPFLNDLSGRQALVANMIGNNSALAKLQTAEGSAALKLAQGQQSEADKKTSRDLSAKTSLLKTLTSNDAKYITQEIGIEKANQSEITRTQIANATNHLSAVRAATSAKNAAINQERYALSLTKAMFPKQTASGQASAARSAQSFFGNASGSNPVYKSVFDPNTGKDVSTWVGGLTYEDAVRQWAASHGGDTGQAAAYANGFYNYGQAGRPFDPGMQQALQAAKADTTIHYAQNGTAYITTEQMAALAHAGYKDFVRTTISTQAAGAGKPQLLKAKDAAEQGVQLPPDTDPNAQVTIWTIKPFHANA